MSYIIDSLLIIILGVWLFFHKAAITLESAEMLGGIGVVFMARLGYLEIQRKKAEKIISAQVKLNDDNPASSGSRPKRPNHNGCGR